MSGNDVRQRRERFERYGWSCNEENLNTLSSTAPKAAKDLAQWLTLEGRRSSLAEWLGVVDPSDSRIHGKFWHIGAWTQRMSHSKPNQANIAAPFHGAPKTAVEEVKAKYDSRMRALWEVEEGNYLVGTDASGIQLRILASIMQSTDYRSAILTGDKALETDIHNLNRKALGPMCRDRDTAKTFIYAWLLGASNTKIAEILQCTAPQASTAVDNFLTSLPELKKIKGLMIPKDARRGYFIGLDGRQVKCSSEHLMLAGYLQSGEAIAMKRWVVEWTRAATKQEIPYKLVDFVHDEVQVEVPTMDAAMKLEEVQKAAIIKVSNDLNLFCPLDIETSVGKSWLQTH